MAHPFEIRDETDIDASPEQVWDAISSAAGLDAWFMGSNEVEQRPGGAVRTSLPGFTMESTITTWEPPHRFRSESPESEDGAFMAFEYEIEGRGGGTTRLRFVHSGFLAGEDWEQEYEALKRGDPAYFFKIGEYLKYFAGRRATPISAFGPPVDRERAWSVFRRELGLDADATVGAPVHVTLAGLGPIDGEVDYVSHDFLGVRTGDAMYRFIHGLGGAVVLGHHIFSDVDRQATEQAWQAWVDRAFV